MRKAVIFVVLMTVALTGAAAFTWLEFPARPQESDRVTSFLPREEPEDCQATFAVIGDYGLAGPDEAAVAELVHGWQPDFVTTTGDNNYPDGAAETIDRNIGQYYSRYVHPYQGSWGPGASVNRFFPALGNHDWEAPGARPYLDYFTLPGNERYYEVEWGPVHLFVIDSDSAEPDGIAVTSRQTAWLKERLSASTLPWQVVTMHHAPYSSSSNHGSNPTLQWPFGEWGADLVLAGHDHVYERLSVKNLLYVVNGLGGNGRYGFGQPLPYTQARFQADFGALKVETNEQQLLLSFYTQAGELVDSAVLSDPQPGAQCGNVPG